MTIENNDTVNKLRQRILSTVIKLQHSSPVLFRRRLCLLFKQTEALLDTRQELDATDFSLKIAMIEKQFSEIVVLSQTDVENHPVSREDLTEMVISQDKITNDLQKSRAEKQRQYDNSYSHLKFISSMDGKLVIPVNEEIKLAMKTFQEARDALSSVDEAIHVITFFGRDVFEELDICE